MPKSRAQKDGPSLGSGLAGQAQSKIKLNQELKKAMIDGDMDKAAKIRAKLKGK